jgi:hypothetical protein
MKTNTNIIWSEIIQNCPLLHLDAHDRIVVYAWIDESDSLTYKFGRWISASVSLMGTPQ